MFQLTTTTITKIVRPRPRNFHKGNFGRVLLIGGTPQYGGAILMAAEACVKSGIGLTTVACHEEVRTSLRTRLPETMTLDYTQHKLLRPILLQADAVVIGPGLGLDATAEELLSLVLAHQQPEQFIVVDGSALTLFSQLRLPLKYPEKIIFTPHQREWQRLSGLTSAEQTVGKNQQARNLLQAYVVLKGPRTILYSNQEPQENSFGTPAQATGGMGDTLAGMIGGFLGAFHNQSWQTGEPRAVIGAAVALHSWLAEKIATENYVVLPTEISRQIPAAMHYFATQAPIEL